MDYKKAYVTGSRTIKIIDEGVKFSGANYFMIPCNLKAGTTVTLSYDSNINIANQMCVKYVGANSFKYCSGHKVTLTNDITDIGIYKGNPSVSEENVIFKNIQLEIGTEVTQYHQYVEPIKKKVFLEEPLRKVGDTADYIDLRNKLLVRKIGVIESYNGETITTEYLSSTGSLTTGATVYYILDNEIVETIDVPDMKTFEDYTKIEILTELPPSRVNLRYEGYTLD